MSDTLNCPYCEAEVQPSDDIRDSNVEIESECPKCGKAFVYMIEYYPTYTPWQADCLNGGEHDWVESIGIPDDWPIRSFRCSMCGANKEEKREVKNDKPL